jgi:hypothetical protein
MAINIPTTSLPSGLVAVDAYARVQSFNGTKDGISAFVFVYASRSAREQELPVIAEMWFHGMPLPATDLMPAIYEWLKTQSAFTGASDV